MEAIKKNPIQSKKNITPLFHLVIYTTHDLRTIYTPEGQSRSKDQKLSLSPDAKSGCDGFDVERRAREKESHFYG